MSNFITPQQQRKEDHQTRELMRAVLRRDTNPARKLVDTQTVSGKVMPMQKRRLPKRNDPCPCMSGKKWKHCHGMNRGYAEDRI